MRKILLVVAISLMAVSVGMADPSCANGTWADYFLSTGAFFSGCHLNNLDFTSFSFSAGGAAINDPSKVGVQVITTLGNEGFKFNPGFAGATLAEDYSVDFNVMATGGNVIDDLGIFFNGTGLGGGVANFTETVTGNNLAIVGGPGLCTPPATPNSCTIQVQNPPPTPNPWEVVFVTPVKTLHVVKDFGGSPNGAGGSFSISDVENTFSNTPEPRLISMLMMGLLAAFGISRKLRGSVTQ